MRGPNWTKMEVDFLKDQYGIMPIGALAELFERPYGSVAQKANELGITDPTCGKVQWSKKEIQFLKNNFDTMTSYQLASALGKQRTKVRMKYKELGLAKMELEKWPDAAVKFLKVNYKTVGDVEIAEILQRLWPKKKGWTKSHISKKRGYLQLDRTKAQYEKIVLKHRGPGGRMNTMPRNSCSVRMTDIWVALRVAWRNPVLAREIVKNHPELIRLKRAQIMLNREIKKKLNAAA